MTRPLVSIVTPTLDPGPRLRRCLDSVASQTYQHVEHIVVDGGSQDGSLDVLGSYPAVKLVAESDTGQSDAINKGMHLASGDVIGWLNADDVLTPRAVEHTISAMGADESVGWTLGNVVVVTGRSGEVEYPARVERPMSWFARNIGAQPGSFFTRKAIDRVGYLDESLHYMMDLDIWIRLHDAGIGHRRLDEVVAVFEVHHGSKSGSESHARFLLDDCAARLKSGRTEAAAFSLGRAAALGATELQVPVDEALERMSEGSAFGDLTSFPRDAVDAGIRAEGAIAGIKRNRLSTLRLIDPRLWADRRIRARLRDALVHDLSRPVRARRARPYLRFLEPLPSER